MESKDSLRKAFLRGDTWIPERHDKEHPEDNRYRAHVNTNKTMAWALKGDHAKKADEAFATSAAAAMPNIAPEHHENFKQMVGSILRDKDRHARTRFSKSPRNAPVPDVKLRHMHSALKGFEGNDIKTSKSNPNRIYVTAVRHGKGGDIAKDFGNFDVWSYEGGKFQHHPKPDMSDIGDNLIQGTQKQVSGLNKLHKSMSDNKDIKHVATVGVVSGNSILMGKRSDTGRYTTPGGHLDPNEKPKAGAFRELMEEAGIEPSSMHYLDSERVRCEDGQDRMIHAFVCFGKHDTDSSNDPDQEVKKWEWVDCSKGLPENVRCNLHSPKNVVLDRLGIFKYRK
jgi:8-oxo-dGTP pyrophosphatase MutT (NUDIX family)